MSFRHLLLQEDQLASRMVGIRIEDLEVAKVSKVREGTIKVLVKVKRQGLWRSSRRARCSANLGCLHLQMCRSLVYPEERGSAVLSRMVTDCLLANTFAGHFEVKIDVQAALHHVPAGLFLGATMLGRSARSPF